MKISTPSNIGSHLREILSSTSVDGPAASEAILDAVRRLPTEDCSLLAMWNICAAAGIIMGKVHFLNPETVSLVDKDGNTIVTLEHKVLETDSVKDVAVAFSKTKIGFSSAPGFHLNEVVFPLIVDPVVSISVLRFLITKIDSISFLPPQLRAVRLDNASENLGISRKHLIRLHGSMPLISAYLI